MTVSTSSPIETQKDALLGEPLPTAAEPTSGRRPHFTAANSLAVAMALSLSAGYLDGFTFVGHGHSFASAMTGNMVLLGINLAALTPEALGNLYPLIAFVFGVISANLLLRKGVRSHLPFSPHFTTLLIEIAVLAGVAFLPGTVDDHILVAVVTVSTAMQNTSFRNIGTRTYNSVIMTGNLQAFSNSLAVGVWPGEAAAREQVRDLGAILTSFVVGAALGAVATPRFGNHATLAPAALLAVVAVALIFSSDDESVFRKA
ncbi:YoaK family protein [Beijerinckia sp. L45]|uniref:YoaK family protein n=1 Tax=Beijerinckia sp. L45 TaxID=1641855 RepID=UPI00131C34E9|nr:YoaK family protein [Beijerinckia sp. L45]